ncbi:HNH endonuclease [Vibrio fluvialis]|nr:HNH endonuclease [Vibrio fluvialis]
MYRDFNAVCEYRSEVPGISGHAVPSNDPSITHVINALTNLSKELENRFQNHRGIKYKFVPSKGASVFPFVPYVAILPPGQSVSDGIYVVICFDKLGRGALVGCGESKTNTQGLKTVTRTIKGKSLRIDVNGPKPNTHYNDVFAQPREFYSPLKTDSELVSYIEDSLDRALVELKLVDKKEVGEIIQNEFDEDLRFDPKNIEDARKKTLREIVARQGQRAFRENLIAEYGRCVITGCSVISVLEAAHIVPYQGESTNVVENGLLLRADIHTLFDLGLISISPQEHKVQVSERLVGTEYDIYQGKSLDIKRVSDEALEFHMSTLYVR